MSTCACCSKPVSFNEIGLSKKLINRATTTFYCKDCLAKKFKVSVDLLNEKIQQFIQSGCALFTKE
ncbi:MAG: hypothetical protein IJY70_00275 [Clostridia bacterium]|nr:hypothetical protein [Clostridia bacterium]